MEVGDRTLELFLAPFSDQASGGVLVVLHDVTEQHLSLIHISTAMWATTCGPWT